MAAIEQQERAPDGSFPLVPELKRQLARLEELLPQLEACGEQDFAAATTLRSMRSLERRVQDELRTAEMLEAGADAEFSLAGDPVQGHEVPARLLGDFLRSIQDLVYAVAQVQVGQPTGRAPVPNTIVIASQLVVLPQFVPGSFGIRVRLHREEELGVPPGSLEENRRALMLAGELIGDALPEADLGELLSHSRVRSHYQRLMGLLAEQNADVSVRTRASLRSATVSAKRARERREWLNLLQTTTRAVTLDGRLVGGSIERRRFELVAQDGSYAGTVSEQAAREMRHLHWGDVVQARLQVTTVEHEDVAGEPTEQYHAESFTRPPEMPAGERALRCTDVDDE